MLAQEDGVNLLSVIKGANMYRRGRQRDFVTDYLPPTLSEFKQTFDVDHMCQNSESCILLSSLSLSLSGKVSEKMNLLQTVSPCTEPSHDVYPEEWKNCSRACWCS